MKCVQTTYLPQNAIAEYIHAEHAKRQIFTTKDTEKHQMNKCVGFPYFWVKCMPVMSHAAPRKLWLTGQTDRQTIALHFPPDKASVISQLATVGPTLVLHGSGTSCVPAMCHIGDIPVLLSKNRR